VRTVATITGVSLAQITALAFGGMKAKMVTVRSDTQAIEPARYQCCSYRKNPSLTISAASSNS
jgi:hypothetical protein